MATEKTNAEDIVHREQAASHSSGDPVHPDSDNIGEIIGRDFTRTHEELPAGYFYSFNFIGSICAIGLAFGCGVGGFTLAAPILGIINADIGPDANIIWVSLAYLLTTSIGLIIVGRISDIFGRRWIFTVGCAIGTIGCVVGATAPNVPALIAAETLIGMAGSVQISYAFAISELVPMKWRFIAQAFVFLWGIPFSGVAPAISYAFVYRTTLGWRGVFYLMIAMNGLATIVFFFCYKPPSFGAKHGSSARKWEFIKHFDYVGTFIITLGLLLFLMGLSWGGTVYPWNSAHVIATIIVGFLLCIGFCFYEAYMPLKEPLLPMRLLKNRGWDITVILWGIGAAVYYANAILWPNMVATMFAANRSYGNMWVGLVACIPNSGILFGEYIGCWYKRRTNIQIGVMFVIATIFLGCMATSTPDTIVRSSIFIFIASSAIGWLELINSAVSTIVIDDQREIGTATGAAGSARSLISTICSTIYTVILSNRLAQTIPANVPSALINAGLPSTSVAGFITGITAGSFEGVPGVSPDIIATGLDAYAIANKQAFDTVFLSTIAFSGLGIVLSFWAPNVDHKLNNDVSVQVGDEFSRAERAEMAQTREEKV